MTKEEEKIMKWSRLFGGPIPQTRVPHPSGHELAGPGHLDRMLAEANTALNAAGAPEETDGPMLEAFVSVMDDNTDNAREAIRRLSPTDSARLAFYARELGRVLSEEDMFREAEDRRQARLSHRDRTAVDELLGQGQDVPDTD